MLRVRTNGASIWDFMPRGAITGVNNSMADPAYKDAFNGYVPYDFPYLANLRVYVPPHILNGSGFVSIDQVKSSCSVIGATWKGISFDYDGSDDLISLGHTTGMANLFDGGGTVAAWINPDTDGEGDVGRILDKWAGWRAFVFDDSGGSNKLVFGQSFSDTSGQWTTSARDITLNAWQFVAVTYNNGAVGNNPTLYINTTARTVGSGLTEDATPVGTRTDDSSANLAIGNAASGVGTFDGDIGEIWGWKGVMLSAIELAFLRNTTRWRYNV